MQSLLCNVNLNCQSISRDAVFPDETGLRNTKSLILIPLRDSLANGINRERLNFSLFYTHS